MAQSYAERFAFMLARVLRRLLGPASARRRFQRPSEPRLAVIRAAARRWTLGPSGQAGGPYR
jgi:hypothetical protein